LAWRRIARVSDSRQNENGLLVRVGDKQRQSARRLALSRPARVAVSGPRVNKLTAEEKSSRLARHISPGESVFSDLL
ncbi:hypothetical protein A2U01_0095456, partial [Trifolium medium]|nr:hypothetical protein [Trifolium medium]